MAKAKKDKIESAGTGSIGTPGPDLPDNGASAERLPVSILAQYIRDLSFENPNAPLPLRRAEGDSNIDVDFSMDARKLEMKDFDNAYEVVLKVSVHARKGEMTTFIVELEYGMMVRLDDVPADRVHPLLLIEMPNYMFPYVRQIISDATQQANYMPFMLSPVNFKALYRKRFGGPKVSTPAAAPEKLTETA